MLRIFAASFAALSLAAAAQAAGFEESAGAVLPAVKAAGAALQGRISGHQAALQAKFAASQGAIEVQEGEYRGQVVSGAYNAKTGEVVWNNGRYIGHVIAVVSTYAESATLQSSSYVVVGGEDNR